MITGCRKFDNLFVSRGEGEGVAGCAPTIFGPGPKLVVIWPIVVSKTRTFLASIHFCQCILSSLPRDSLIFTTFKCYFYYSYKEWYDFLLFVSRSSKSANRRGERSEKYRFGLIFLETKNTKYNARYKFNSERWFQLLSLFFLFFFFVYTPSWKGRPASNKQCHDKEKKFRSSGKHWWASRSHIGPFVAFYAFHSPFSHPFTSSSFHTRSRPVFPIYRFIVVYLRFVAHASRESWFTVNFLFECWPHFSLPRLRLSRDFSRYWPRSLRLTGIDCCNRGNAKFNPWTTNYNVNLLVKIICNNRTKSERFQF